LISADLPKAATAITKKFLKAAKTYISRFPKVAGNFMKKIMRKLSKPVALRNLFIGH
jgi:hypothetical protein